MRNTLELLRILRSNLETLMVQYNTNGSCIVVGILQNRKIISKEEADHLSNYIREHMPKDYYVKDLVAPDVYGWELGETKPRMEFLDVRIELEENKELDGE